MDIVLWLRSLGLGKYEAAFRENEIDETVLPSLTEGRYPSRRARDWFVQQGRLVRYAGPVRQMRACAPGRRYPIAAGVRASDYGS